MPQTHVGAGFAPILAPQRLNLNQTPPDPCLLWEQKSAAIAEEIAQWRALGEDTGFPDTDAIDIGG